MRKTGKFNIDGHNIEIYQLPVPISLKVLTRLTKILSRPLGNVITGDSNVKESITSVMDKKVDFGDILGALGDRLDEDVVITTIEMMLPYLTIDGKNPRNLESFDDYGTVFLLKTIYKSLEFNYSDFFAGLLEKGAKEKESTK